MQQPRPSAVSDQYLDYNNACFDARCRVYYDANMKASGRVFVLLCTLYITSLTNDQNIATATRGRYNVCLSYFLPIPVSSQQFLAWVIFN